MQAKLNCIKFLKNSLLYKIMTRYYYHRSRKSETCCSDQDDVVNKKLQKISIDQLAMWLPEFEMFFLRLFNNVL